MFSPTVTAVVRDCCWSCLMYCCYCLYFFLYFYCILYVQIVYSPTNPLHSEFVVICLNWMTIIKDTLNMKDRDWWIPRRLSYNINQSSEPNISIGEQLNNILNSWCNSVHWSTKLILHNRKDNENVTAWLVSRRTQNPRKNIKAECRKIQKELKDVSLKDFKINIFNIY